MTHQPARLYHICTADTQDIPNGAPLDIQWIDPGASHIGGWARWSGTDCSLPRPRPTYELTYNGAKLPERYVATQGRLIALSTWQSLCTLLRTLVQHAAQPTNALPAALKEDLHGSSPDS